MIPQYLRFFIKSLICCCVFFLTSACTTPAIKADETNSIAKTYSAEKLTQFEITGAIAAKNKHKAWAASLTWQQFNAHDYFMRLYGPLNGGTLLLESKHGVVTYRDGQKTLQSRDAGALLLKETGLNLPLDQLYYWVRGLPAPHRPFTAHYNTQHQLQTLKQGQFELQFTTYSVFNQISLPSKILINHPEGSVKLVIKQWANIESKS